MKLATKTIRNDIIFTADTVYSNAIFVNIRYDILSALKGKRLSLNLSKSYTHTAKQSKSFFIPSYLIVENF